MTEEMNRISNIFLACSLLTLASCASDDFLEDNALPAGEGTVSFSISTGTSEIGVATRADGGEGKISEMVWMVADTQGRVIDHHYGRLTDDFSRLTVEGLKYGDYNMFFLATIDGSSNAEISEPKDFSENWLSTAADGSPVDGYYCYAKVPFEVGERNPEMNVVLEHNVARVCVEVEMPNASQWRYIKNVKVTFNETVPAAFTAGGEYSGEMKVNGYDIFDGTDDLSFATFPSSAPISGYVEILSSRDGADDFMQRYEFSDLALEAGKIARIKISYRHPDRESGKMHIAADQLWRFPVDTMFLAREPREVFYENTIRQFYADQPLQVFISESGDMRVKFYSPIAIKDVKVKARFSKVSPEWVDFAYLEEVRPFMDATFPLPLKNAECVYNCESGRKIRIPAHPGLSSNDVQFAIECDDPFMRKIAIIDSHWNIRFSPYQADQGHAYWRHMDPLLCRHGVALALNMAYMFASPEFNEELETYDGILYDNAHNPIVLDNLRSNIRNHPGLRLGRVVGVGGLGGGETYGLADYCYTGVYHNSTPEGSNPHNYPRQAMFHEYGHCLGYSHDSNMTYGDQWTVLCATVFVEMGRAGKLPVSDITDVTDLPME